MRDKMHRLAWRAFICLWASIAIFTINTWAQQGLLAFAGSLAVLAFFVFSLAVAITRIKGFFA